MRRHPMKGEARARWMRAAEAEATRLDPGLAGRIDWDSALWLYLNGFDPFTAGARLAQLPRPN